MYFDHFPCAILNFYTTDYSISKHIDSKLDYDSTPKCSEKISSVKSKIKYDCYRLKTKSWRMMYSF